MKEIVKRIKAYNFKELSKEIQEKLIEKEKKEIENLYCETCLFDDMEEEAINLLEKNFKNKANYKKIYYDLSYCQGSGAMIEFDLLYYNKNIKIKHNNGFYYNENSFEIIEEYGEELTEKQYKQLKEKIYNINCLLTKYGYKNIEYFWNAEKEAIENLKNKLFTINGEIIEE